MPSPDDEKEDKVWESNWHIERIVPEGVNGMVIFAFARFDIMRKMYENLTVLIDSGNSTVMENSTLPTEVFCQ